MKHNHNSLPLSYAIYAALQIIWLQPKLFKITNTATKITLMDQVYLCWDQYRDMVTVKHW